MEPDFELGQPGNQRQIYHHPRLERARTRSVFLKQFENFMENLSDKELAAFYLAAVNTKSELLAAALVKGHITAEQAFDAANLEELWQSEHWGRESTSEQRRQDLKRELHDIEQFLRQ